MKPLVVLGVMVCCVTFAFAQSEPSPRLWFDEAMAFFSQGDYEQAAVRLRQVTESPTAAQLHPDAFFWLGRAHLAQLDSFEATRYFDHLIRTYPSHPRVPDASYQRARSRFVSEDYQDALIGFEGFIREFPDSPYVANAYYWAAEALLILGHRERARELFETVVQNYPTSFRVEAAQYQLSLLSLGEREQQLQRLLQWSHEEHLQTIESFRRAQSAWVDAIAAYRDAVSGQPAGDAAEIAALRTEIAELLTRLAESRGEIADLRSARPGGSTAEGDLAVRLHLAELKEATLRIKEQLLRDIDTGRMGSGQ